MKKGTSQTPKELNEGYKEEVLSSGVKVKILPFPARLWEKIHERVLREFPEVKPPKKTINVLGGTEEIDDLKAPDYLVTKIEVDRQRNAQQSKLVGEATLDLCVEVDPTPYLPELKRAAVYGGEIIPSDETELKIYFLETFALRSRGDYERVISMAAALMAVGDAEVAERINSFRDNLAQPTPNGTDAPGADEIQRVEVEQAQTGT
jgi:hypothetical protein